MAREPLVYIVIVNYGRATDTIACLRTLCNIEGPSFKVLLIDNGSLDDSTQKLADWLRCASNECLTRENLPKYDSLSYSIQFIEQPYNLGFAGGCNIGMRIAMADPHCTHVWLLNNDTLVEPDSLATLIARCKADPKIGMCGSTLIYHSPKDRLQGCGGQFDIRLGRGRPIGAFNHRDDLPAQREVELAMDYVIGASMLLTIDLLRQVGLMDERYFLYFEEFDLAIRARALGFSLAWAPASCVIHKEGAAIGTSTRGLPSPMSTYFMTAGYLRLVRANRVETLPIAVIVTFLRAIKFMFQLEWPLAKVVLQALAAFARSPNCYQPGSFRGVGALPS